jgi:hypothetical protein
VEQLIHRDMLLQPGDDLLDLLRPHLHLAAVELVGVLHEHHLDHLTYLQLGFVESLHLRVASFDRRGSLLFLRLFLFLLLTA